MNSLGWLILCDMLGNASDIGDTRRNLSAVSGGKESYIRQSIEYVHVCLLRVFGTNGWTKLASGAQNNRLETAVVAGDHRIYH